MSENIIYEKFEELVVDVLTDDEISKIRNVQTRFYSDYFITYQINYFRNIGFISKKINN